LHGLQDGHRRYISEALVQRSATGHHLVFDGPLISSLPSRLGNERIRASAREHSVKDGDADRSFCLWGKK
jgi:hypothetical protein